MPTDKRGDFFLFQILMCHAVCCLRGTYAAKFYCWTCGKDLCPKCKDGHLKNFFQHNVVPFAERPDSDYVAKLQCKTHEGYASQYWCETCKAQLCVSCIANEHRDHHYSNVIVKLLQKRCIMKKEQTGLCKIVSKREHFLRRNQVVTAIYLCNMDKIGKQIAARATELHKEIDREGLSNNRTDIEQRTYIRLQHEHIDATISSLHKELQKISEIDLDKLMNSERVIKEMSDDFRIIEYQLRNSDPNIPLLFREDTLIKTVLSPIESIPLPFLFIVSKDIAKILTGRFWILFDQQIRHLIKPSSSVKSPYQRTKSRKWTSNAFNVLSDPSLDSAFVVKQPIPLLICTGSRKAWVRGNEKSVYLVDKAGAVENALQIDYSFHDMTMTPQGNILITAYNFNFIMQIDKNGDTTIVVDTEPWTPFGVFATSDFIYVTFPEDDKVVEYNKYGKVTNKMDDLKFSYPFRVILNQENNFLFISDMAGNSLEATGSVIIIDDDGKLHCVYEGQGDLKFTPRDLCADPLGHVLIADYVNNRVHILAKEGQFIQNLFTSNTRLRRPCTISVDDEGYVWIGTFVLGSKGRVQTAKFLR